MSTVKIRDARQEDAERIRDVTLSAYEQYGSVMSKPHWEAYRESIIETLGHVKPAQQFIAERDGNIVGTVLLYPTGSEIQTTNGDPIVREFPEIRLLAVTPEARGQGIAKSLVEECIKRARATGVRALSLHTTDMMMTAMKLYERMGFTRNPKTDFSPGGGILVKGYIFDLNHTSPA